MPPSSGDSSLDRNTLIATVLITVVMFVWLWMLPQPVPEQPGGTEQPVEDTTAVVEQQTPPPAQEEPLTQPQNVPVADSTIAGAQQGEQRFIVVENDLYQARFSSKGATLVSFVLKEYQKFDQQTPIQLVDTTNAGEGALSLVFTTPQNHVVDTRSFYFEPSMERDTLRVTEDTVSLAFESRVGAGRLRLVYTFHPGEYEVGLRVEHQNTRSFSADGGYELIWDGGVPFSESDPENEGMHTGAFARSGGEVVSVTLEEDGHQERALRGNVSWVAVKSKYFTAVMMPEEETIGADLIGDRVNQRGAPDYWEDYMVSLQMPPVERTADAFTLYLGPMEFYRITDYNRGLYDMVDYGWDFFEFMTRPLAKFVFIPAFEFLGEVLPNYGLVIIILAVLIKILVYPLTKTSYKSMARMRELQPKMQEIKEKYGDNPQKQQEAMMKMYKETGVNPLGGCLPMLLQYPIIIALWQFLPQAIEIRQKGFLWAHDLSAPDAILHLPFTIPLYGDFVAGFTLLMGLSMVVQMRLQSPGSNAQAKVLAYVFPIFIFAIFNGLASGLSLYYLSYNIVTAIQQHWINRSLEKEGIGSNGKGSKKDAKAAKQSKKRRASKART